MQLSTMSRFNTEQICVECEGIEGGHPEFSHAVRVEEAHVKLGNYNYAGVGLPYDLREDADIRKANR